MNINYTIRITNPTSDLLTPSEDLKSEGQISIERIPQGIIISGYKKENSLIKKAYTNAYIGEEFFLNQGASIELTSDDRRYYQHDVKNLFNLVGKSIQSVEWKRVQTYFKSTTGVLDIFIEDPADIFVISIDSNGLISKVTLDETKVQKTNNLALVNPSGILMYCLINKPLSIKTDDYLFINQNEFSNLPQGFCTVSNNLSDLSNTQLNIVDGLYTYKSYSDDKLTLSSNLLIDNVLLQTYSIKALESIILEPSVEDYTSLLYYTERPENYVCIFKLLPDNSLEPVVAVNTMDEDTTNTGSLEVYNELIQADVEFKKHYVYQEYKIQLLTKAGSFTLFNKEILSVLKNQFNGRVIKL